MERNEFIKKNLLSFVSYFFIMLIIYYFVFPNDTFSERITDSLMITTIYHIPILLKYFKENRRINKNTGEVEDVSFLKKRNRRT